MSEFSDAERSDVEEVASVIVGDVVRQAYERARAMMSAQAAAAEATGGSSATLPSAGSSSVAMPGNSGSGSGSVEGLIAGEPLAPLASHWRQGSELSQQGSAYAAVRGNDDFELLDGDSRLGMGSLLGPVLPFYQDTATGRQGKVWPPTSGRQDGPQVGGGGGGGKDGGGGGKAGRRARPRRRRRDDVAADGHFHGSERSGFAEREHGLGDGRDGGVREAGLAEVEMKPPQHPRGSGGSSLATLSAVADAESSRPAAPRQVAQPPVVMDPAVALRRLEDLRRIAAFVCNSPLAGNAQAASPTQGHHRSRHGSSRRQPLSPIHLPPGRAHRSVRQQAEAAVSAREAVTLLAHPDNRVAVNLLESTQDVLQASRQAQRRLLTAMRRREQRQRAADDAASQRVAEESLGQGSSTHGWGSASQADLGGEMVGGSASVVQQTAGSSSVFSAAVSLPSDGDHSGTVEGTQLSVPGGAGGDRAPGAPPSLRVDNASAVQEAMAAWDATVANQVLAVFGSDVSRRSFLTKDDRETSR
jgi:hypothetical protein